MAVSDAGDSYPIPFLKKNLNSSPREKMQVDVQEMIYWLQQERRQRVLQSASLGHATIGMP